MEPNEQKTPPDLDKTLDAADKAYINALGISVHMLAHPVKVGPAGLAFAAISIPLYGFCFALNNAVRLGVAAGKASDMPRTAAESARESSTDSEPKTAD